MNALPAQRPVGLCGAEGDAVDRQTAGAIETQAQMALAHQPQVADYKLAVEQRRRIALAPGRGPRERVGEVQGEVFRPELAVA